MLKGISFAIFIIFTIDVSDGNVDIAAFNIQVFGTTKLDKPFIVDALVEIIKKYDIIFVQEIRDSSGTAIEEFLDILNAQIFPEEKEKTFRLVLDDRRLGRTNSKEQYAYIYRADIIEVIGTYQYPDKENKFERPPFCVKFKVPKAKVEEFAIIGAHITPQDVPGEIDALIDVYEVVRKELKTENIIITGDFNAGCSYLNVGERKNSKLLNDERFRSVLSPDADTTVATSSCPYDRMLITGDALRSSVASAGVDHFDQSQGLTNDMAKHVSDHYPIYMSLVMKDETKTGETKTFEKNSIPVSIDDIGRAVEEATLFGFKEKVNAHAPVNLYKTAIGKKGLFKLFYDVLEKLSSVLSPQQVNKANEYVVSIENEINKISHNLLNHYHFTIQCKGETGGHDYHPSNWRCVLKLKIDFN